MPNDDSIREGAPMSGDKATRYKITRAISGSDRSIDLSRGAYETIVDAKRRLLVVLGIEEKFDLLLENYTEYEEALLSLAFRQLLHREFDWGAYQDRRLLVNRRVANLLSAIRMYADQVPKDLAQAFARGSPPCETFETGKETEKGRSLGFRAMKEIRNYVQHYSLAVHGLDHPSKWVDPPAASTSRLGFRIAPSLDLTQLEQDPETRGRAHREAIIQELRARAKSTTRGGRVYAYVPLTPLIRECVEGYGRLHEALRKAMAREVARWEAALDNVEERAQAEFDGLPGGYLDGLVVVAETPDGPWAESHDIFHDIAKRRLALATKNQGFQRLVDRYVSGALED